MHTRPDTLQFVIEPDSTGPVGIAFPNLWYLQASVSYAIWAGVVMPNLV
jgi:hypothetical protein